MSYTRFCGLMALGLSVTLAACGGDEVAEVEASTDVATTTEAPAAAAADVPATGNVIVVKMVTDGAGNYFEPAVVDAKPGDVIRFELVSGVHNVSFPADKNASAANLPEASPYLQIAGQTYDMPVNLSPGSYEFVCDPHAALGMVGTLNVTE